MRTGKKAVPSSPPNNSAIPSAPTGKERELKPKGSRIKAKATIKRPSAAASERALDTTSPSSKKPVWKKIPELTQDTGTRMISKRLPKAARGFINQKRSRYTPPIRLARNTRITLFPFFGKIDRKEKNTSAVKPYTHKRAPVITMAKASLQEAIRRSPPLVKVERGAWDPQNTWDLK
jgi:hypothetical protein